MMLKLLAGLVAAPMLLLAAPATVAPAVVHTARPAQDCPYPDDIVLSYTMSSGREHLHERAPFIVHGVVYVHVLCTPIIAILNIALERKNKVHRSYIWQKVGDSYTPDFSGAPPDIYPYRVSHLCLKGRYRIHVHSYPGVTSQGNSEGAHDFFYPSKYGFFFRCNRVQVVPRNEARSHMAVETASTMSRGCPPNAERCITTGAGRVGLAIVGGHGLASTNLAGYDYEGAPEWWFQNGNLYLLSKRGWVGGEICLVNATHARWITSCLTQNLLARLIALAHAAR